MVKIRSFFAGGQPAAGSFAHYKFKWETMKKLKQDEEEEVIITNGVKECFMLNIALQFHFDSVIPSVVMSTVYVNVFELHNYK